MQLLDWLSAHFLAFIAILTALGTFAGIVAKYTTGRISAVAAAVAGAAVDVVKIYESLMALKNGEPPPGSNALRRKLLAESSTRPELPSSGDSGRFARRSLAYAGIAVLCVACAGLPAVISYTGQDVACVIGQVDAGVSVTTAIQGVCHNLTEETIGAIIADFFIGLETVPDAGSSSELAERLRPKLSLVKMSDGSLAVTHPSHRAAQ